MKMRKVRNMKVRMGEILSLRIKNNMEELKSLVPRPAPGVPDNALPGWADVPLYDKLPMLDCPGNAIVFTGGKMGKVQRFQGAYDSNCKNEASEYNALVDPHLTNYYMRRRNLDHLKKIGKITESNDVICNAQQFNEYRRKLNRYHLFAIYKELKRLEQERDDRANIKHAEIIVDQDRKKCSDDPSNVHHTKLLIEQKKHEKNVANYQKIEEKIQRIKKLNELKAIILQQKKILHNIAIEQHQLAKSDILRMRIIAVKRNNRIRTERSNLHIRNYFENMKQAKMEKAQFKWQKQLIERRKKHERNVKMIAVNAHEKAINVEKRKKLSQKRWQRILAQIAQKSENTKRRKAGKNLIIQKLEKFLKNNIQNTESSSMGVVTRKDISEAVDTALYIGPRKKCSSDMDSNSIYDTAKYIIENILFMINEDLSKNNQLMKHVSKQIDEYFLNGKEGIIKKVSNIIKQIDTNLQSQQQIKNNLADQRISFNKHDIIGDSAMQENLALVLKPVRSRTPTPAGSLTSLLGIMKYEFLEDPKNVEEINPTYTKEQMIFAEHFLIKFKRLFIVGVERKVFEAIQLYQKGKLYSFNRKLLKIDRSYLIEVMSQSILAYNVNRFDFEGNLRLCISAMSSDIIWDLQNNYMRPIIDPKCIRYPKSRCDCQPIHCFGLTGQNCCHCRMN